MTDAVALDPMHRTETWALATWRRGRTACWFLAPGVAGSPHRGIN